MRDSIPYLTPQEPLGKVEPSLLDRERSIARPGYSRWLVPRPDSYVNL